MQPYVTVGFVTFYSPAGFLLLILMQVDGVVSGKCRRRMDGNGEFFEAIAYVLTIWN